LAHHRETSPHDGKLAEFNNAGPKIPGALPQKNLGPKTCEILVNFVPLRTLIANISGMRQHIQNRKTTQLRAIPSAYVK